MSSWWNSAKLNKLLHSYKCLHKFKECFPYHYIGRQHPKKRKNTPRKRSSISVSMTSTSAAHLAEKPPPTPMTYTPPTSLTPRLTTQGISRTFDLFPLFPYIFHEWTIGQSFSRLYGTCESPAILPFLHTRQLQSRLFSFVLPRQWNKLPNTLSGNMPIYFQKPLEDPPLHLRS